MGVWASQGFWPTELSSMALGKAQGKEILISSCACEHFHGHLPTTLSSSFSQRTHLT